MFDRDPLAVVMAVMPRMRDPAMQGVVAYNFLRAGPMARAHLVSNGRLRLRGLILRRCDGSRRGRFSAKAAVLRPKAVTVASASTTSCITAD